MTTSSNPPTPDYEAMTPVQLQNAIWERCGGEAPYLPPLYFDAVKPWRAADGTTHREWWAQDPRAAWDLIHSAMDTVDGFLVLTLSAMRYEGDEQYHARLYNHITGQVYRAGSGRSLPMALAIAWLHWKDNDHD